MPRFLTIIAALGLLAVALPARAQDRPSPTGEVRALVSYTTDDNVYLDAGREEGISRGDTLDVVVDGLVVGRLLVTATASHRSLTVFVGPRFDVAMGDVLTVRFEESGAEVADRPESPVPAGDRPSLFAGDDRARQGRRTRPLRFSGHIRIGASARSTATDAGPLDGSARVVASSRASVRLSVANLPGGWDAVLDARLSRRYAENSIVGADEQARIYRLSLVRSDFGSPLELEAGRYTLDQDAAHGYWDGVRAGYRSRTASMGLSVGLEPDAWNGAVQTGVPKAAGYAEVRLRPGDWRLATTVAAVHVRPTIEWLDHTYVGLSQDVRLGAFRLDGDLLVDRNPEDAGWAASRISVRTTIPITHGLQVTLRHFERTPYLYWRSSDVLGTRRSRESASVTWSPGDASVTASWTSNDAEAGVRSTAWSGSARVSRTAVLGLGFSVSASVWESPGSTSLFSAASLHRRMGSSRVDVTWRHYALESGNRTFRSESVRLQFITPVGRHFRIDGSGQLDFGDVATGVGSSLGITYSF